MEASFAMSKTATLTATPREKVGSRYAQRLRAQGRLPAVLYGHREEPLAMSLDARECLRLIHSGTRVFHLEIEGKGQQTALLKDIQYDYLGSNVIHADFERVDLAETVEVNVQVNFVGDPVGLKTAGAIMLHPATEIICRCAVANVTDHVDVDVSALETGHSLHAGEIALPEGMTLVSDPETVLATIVVQKKGDVEVGEEAEVEAEGAEPEVISEKKEEEKASE
ncbi:MAG: 50S ribosomal protein L25 [Planctomycetota bacterium]|nr:MAG: 50S ribosomal protein L25 [Planctomycetota bacterium]